MANYLKVPCQIKKKGKWGKLFAALVDTGAANAVFPNVEGKHICDTAYADIMGDRYWGSIKRVEARVPTSTCAAHVEAFVPEGKDPRSSEKRDASRPSRLKGLGDLMPILGHRFLEATGGVVRFGKRDSLNCDRSNADPLVSHFVAEAPTMRVGLVCVRPKKVVKRK